MSDTRSHSGIGFVGALTILFIGLKLTDHISWPWVWVLSPIWITISLVFIVGVPIAVYLLKKDRDYRKRHGENS